MIVPLEPETVDVFSKMSIKEVSSISEIICSWATVRYIEHDGKPISLKPLVEMAMKANAKEKDEKLHINPVFIRFLLLNSRDWVQTEGNDDGDDGEPTYEPANHVHFMKLQLSSKPFGAHHPAD